MVVGGAAGPAEGDDATGRRMQQQYAMRQPRQPAAKMGINHIQMERREVVDGAAAKGTMLLFE